MAKFTPTIGILEGKLDGTVFSSGKGGRYLRSFKKPTNPNTPAQMKARANFGTTSRSYAATPLLLKESFANYASNGFSPKRPRSGVSYSGAQAYASLYNQCISMHQLRPDNVTVPGVTPPFVPQPLPFGVKEYAPSGVFGAFGSLFAIGLPVSFSLSDVVVDVSVGTGTTLELFSPELASVMGSGNKFILKNEAFGEFFGFAIYLSSPLNFFGQRPKSPEGILAGVIPCFENELLTDDYAINGVFKIKNALTDNLANSKFLFKIGMKCVATVYAISESGASALVGSKEITLS